MKRYPEYKDSGIDCIGAVPQNWTIRKAATLGQFTKGRGITKEDIVPFGLSCIRYGEIYTAYNRIVYNLISHISEESSKFSQVAHKGDILFTGSGETLDEIGKSVLYYGDDDIYVGGDIIILTPKNGFSPLFLSFVLNSYCVNYQKATYGRGEIIVHIHAKQLKELTLAMPSLFEQTCISDFLSIKTLQIDDLIAQKQKLIELLKEERTALINQAVTKGLNPNVPIKDSGNEWLGEIPEHWSVIPLKYIIQDLKSGVSVNSEDKPASVNEIAVLKTSCVYNYYFESEENKKVWESEYERVACPVKGNSIIISRMNTPELVGASGYVEKDYPNLFLPDRLWITEFYQKVEMDVKWLSYLFVSQSFRSLLSSKATGTSPSMKNISKEDLLSIRIPFPLFEEQSQIRITLEESNRRSESLISKISSEIDLLSEYKTSLINDAVTGKIDVRLNSI